MKNIAKKITFLSLILFLALALCLPFCNNIVLFADETTSYKLTLDEAQLLPFNNGDFASGTLTDWNSVVLYSGANDDPPVNSGNEVSVVNTASDWYTGRGPSSENLENIGGDTSVDSVSGEGDNAVNNNYALLFNNTVPGASYVLSNNSITFAAHKLYVLTLNVKIGKANSANGITLELIENEPAADSLIKKETPSYEAKTFAIEKIVSNVTDTGTNNYVTCIFLIKGHDLFATTAKLKISFGLTDTEKVENVDTDKIKSSETGFALVDSVKFYQISTAQYNTISSGDKTNRKLCTASFSTTTSTAKITNGYFNNVNYTGYGDTYPLTPSNWTQTKADGDTSSTFGIINTNADHFNLNRGSYGLNEADNPGKTTAQKDSTAELSDISNNILMLRNSTAGYQTVKSAITSLSANSYYKFTVDVATYAISTGGINIYLETSDGDRVYTKTNVNSTGFTQYTLGIQTGKDALALRFVVELGTSETAASGFAFIDDVTISDTNKAAFTTLTETESETVNKLVYESTPETEDNSSETPNPDTSADNSNPNIDAATLAYLIPSIVLGLALIIGVVAIIVKKVKIKKYNKLTAINYDRKDTLEKHISKREELNKIKSSKADLEGQKAALTEEMEKLDAEYTQKENHSSAEFKAYTANKNKLQNKIAAISTQITKIDSTVSSKEKEKPVEKYYKKTKKVKKSKSKQKSKKPNKNKRK